jgi:hypothetical protein
LAVLAALGVGVWYLLRPRGLPPEPEPAVGDVWFEDVAEKAGLAFRHFDPATPLHLMPETMGSGLGWIDYDADGWPDLFCVQDGPLPPASDPSKTHHLYRNNRDGTFADVTDGVGLNKSGYGAGCAVGDYDNDGFDDLVVTYLGGIQLFHNVADPAAPGGRRFADVTPTSGLADTHWGTSCAWGDLDGDGFLDLYVCNYVEIDPAKPVTCLHEQKKLYYQCSPSVFPYTQHLLFRNNGNGTFTDVSEASGIRGAALAPGLGVAIADLDGDGKQDVYVANDMNPAYLFHNLGGMKFEEAGLRSGCALGPGGNRIAGMGVDVADVDASGRPSVFVTNFQSAPNVLFLNRGNLRFFDATYPSGLGGPSLDRLGFGTCALDADLDGDADFAVANGHVQRIAREGYGVPYAQEAQLFLGDGSAKFRDVSAGAGGDFRKPRVGRGLARADFDNDGLPDLAMSGVGEQVSLFRNRSGTKNGWVSLELAGDGRASNRSAIGAVVTAEWAGKKRSHFVVGGGSYLSASDRRLLLGLGDAAKLDRVTVRWPSGKVQEFRDLPARTRWRLRDGLVAAEPV